MTPWLRKYRWCVKCHLWRQGEQPVKTQAWVRAHELGFYSDDMNATDAYGIAWAARAMQEPP